MPRKKSKVFQINGANVILWPHSENETWILIGIILRHSRSSSPSAQGYEGRGPYPANGKTE
jgi:hypothetical protein